MKLKIAVHKGCHNKTNPELVASGWLNVLVDIEWLKQWVSHGWGWMSVHLNDDRYRLLSNCISSNMVVMDLDGDCTLERFWSTQVAKDWCALTYTSASHSNQEHRFRALFPLGLTMKSKSQHKATYHFIVNRLLLELQLDSLKDNCGSGWSRLWYGNDQAIFIDGNPVGPVPADVLETIEYTDVSSLDEPDCSLKDLERCIWLLRQFLRPSEDGEFNEYYIHVTGACGRIGAGIEDAWVDWVDSGHHGLKQHNRDPNRLLSFEGGAGHLSLFSIAKEQDPQWQRRLPLHLAFSIEKAYSEEPMQDPSWNL